MDPLAGPASSGDRHRITWIGTLAQLKLRKIWNFSRFATDQLAGLALVTSLDLGYTRIDRLSPSVSAWPKGSGRGLVAHPTWSQTSAVYFRSPADVLSSPANRGPSSPSSPVSGFRQSGSEQPGGSTPVVRACRVRPKRLRYASARKGTGQSLLDRTELSSRMTGATLRSQGGL